MLNCGLPGGGGRHTHRGAVVELFPPNVLGAHFSTKLLVFPQGLNITGEGSCRQ
jgi:hypothetical protein